MNESPGFTDPEAERIRLDAMVSELRKGDATPPALSKEQLAVLMKRRPFKRARRRDAERKLRAMTPAQRRKHTQAAQAAAAARRVPAAPGRPVGGLKTAGS